MITEDGVDHWQVRCWSFFLIGFFCELGFFCSQKALLQCDAADGHETFPVITRRKPVADRKLP